MYDFDLPITEQSNELTKDIDKTEIKDIIEFLLSKTDNQIFEALIDNTGVYTKLETIARFIRVKETRVILSGCGTSGRLAYIYSQYLNQYLKADKCDYIIAGDDKALVDSVELVEDSCEHGEIELKKRISGLDSFVYIGISCGLSAAFVAAQLDYLNHTQSDKCEAIVLIGFNRANQARNDPIILPNSKLTTFKAILSALESNAKFHLLNPIIGPEPICGSTRMKSGTATKILLDCLAIKSINPNIDLKFLLQQYKSVVDHVIYTNRNTINQLTCILNESIKCLKSGGGSINYLCRGRVELGVLGCVDASECLPTFGASRCQIMCLMDIEEDSAYWKQFRSLKPIDANQLQTGKNNFQLELDYDDDGCGAFNLNFVHDSLKDFVKSNRFKSGLFENEYFLKSLEFLCFKLVLNGISTVSFASIGKIYSNYMIDVNVSNSKLYNRALRIVGLVAHGESTSSELCLLRSIYSTDNQEVFANKTITHHIEMGRTKKYAVPVAIIMKLTGCSYVKAIEMIDKYSNIRSCIEKIRQH
jgi:N-acetylmuramic acid 6-phosphate (MurNAc-6-P) etherase